MFVVHHLNFGTFKEFATFEEAKAFAIKACFEAVVTLNGMTVGSFNPITGSFRNAAGWQG